MGSFRFTHYLMEPRNWWLPLLIIFTVSIAGVMMIGIHTYTEAPPIVNFTTADGAVVIEAKDITAGQLVFQKYGLMDYGSMFGDGANRGPDYTAEALHLTATFMRQFYQQQATQAPEKEQELLRLGIEKQVQQEIKQNNYSPQDQRIVITPAQAYAAKRLAEHYVAQLPQTRTVTNPTEIRSLSSFFFWGAWVCGAERPGETFSYTHNWPYDPEVGNTPTAPVVLWSIIGSFGLIIGLGLVLYFHGSLDKLTSETYTSRARPFLSALDVAAYVPHPIQRSAFAFLYVAMLLFGLQVLAGILTVHDFVGFVHFFGFDISTLLPVVITRSWHVQLSLLWISACWIGGSLFVLPIIAPNQPHGQRGLIRGIFIITLLMVAGMMVGIFMGPHGLLADAWYWFGHQGWEYVELGKTWQILLAVVLLLWSITMYRGLKPAFVKGQPWGLPNWMVYATGSIMILLVSGFITQPETNFVIADFWRWCVIHMWAEAFFEVFTTVLIGSFMVLMGLVSKQAAIRVIYIATLLFLGSGLLGISHNFYWNAKPVGTMALGSVFSTLQVIPLVLLTLEAWRFSRLPSTLASGIQEPKAMFGFPDVFLFLVGVNFWNFFGAGVLGFIINLPIANYYEHGSYLTVNHGHAALMGVYGNLALAAVLFCSRLVMNDHAWNPRLTRTAFWSINVGLLLMVILDLFPVGLYQFLTIVERGFWYARSAEFVDGATFQTFTWLRIVGGALFTLGGVIPILWLIMRGPRNLKPSGKPTVSFPEE
ncbi:MAG: cbb3-type cytochrome c oxidase subunit I [Chlorobi bacterium]|nr:cbb3-type cytochrome c oxidase subunit I [Chlorobiota bacterium]